MEIRRLPSVPPRPVVPNRRVLGIGTCIGLLALVANVRAEAPLVQPAESPLIQPNGGVSYSRDIRPILSDRCFVCHGPDPSMREADLRLDSFDFATKDRDGVVPIVPGDLAASELWRRISSTDPEEFMPPERSHRKQLDAAERELFKRWIEEGANYEQHWAFVRPVRSSTMPAETMNAIDAFVQARLLNSELDPSPAVSPELALRRLFLDVTGLPATPEETDAFLLERSNADPDQVWREWIEKLFTQEPYRSRYAERMASPWMDQARYADTSGIHMDAGRQIWPWRDWVLRAYRDNMPFDQFLTEQLAGDLLPNATLDQIVASGFNRNHITTDEGGAIDAEYLVEYAADRAETTSLVFLGLTLGCARCHDHKFDPVSQTEYYELFAFFASNEEPGLYSQIPNPRRALEPFLEVPSADQTVLRERLALDLEALQSSLEEPSEQDGIDYASFREDLSTDLGMVRAATTYGELTSSGGASLDVTERGTILASGTNPEREQHTLRLRTDATELRLIQLDVLGHESFTKGAPGRAPNGNAVLTGVRMEAVSLLDPQQRQSLEVSWLWADAAQKNEDWSLQRALDERPNTGWAIGGHTEGTERVALFLTDEAFGYEGGTELALTLEYDSIYASHAFGHVRVSLASLPAEGLAQLPLAQGHWYHAGPFPVKTPGEAYSLKFGPELNPDFNLADEFELEGGGRVRWSFKADFEDGVVTALAAGTNIHYVAREIYSPDDRTLEVSLGSDDGFVLFVNGEVVAEREVPRGVAADQDRATISLHAGRNRLMLKVINTGGAAGFYYKALEGALGLNADLVAALADLSVHASGNPGIEERITHAWRLSRSPEYRLGQEQLSTIQEDLTTLEAEIPQTMVMREREEPRETYVLIRGAYDKPDKDRPVLPGVPRALGELAVFDENGEPRRATRLDLADWMTSRENPLVARVAVNRLWQMIFGAGLVATSGDFGHQGAWPSQPELLDWLSVEFMENDWDIQHMLALILSSDTYLQSSHVSAVALESDPENRLLSHYPRHRLDAERLRDQALFVAGLLAEELGGESVKPYHPEGLWREVAMSQSNTRIYERGEGTDLWRRSLYTYWKRACPPPSLMTFNAPTREACVTLRASTNTPLQALVLWNDEQYLEAARVLAERTLEAGADAQASLVNMFRRCTGRAPSERELELLDAALEDHLTRYKEHPEEAAALIAIGERELAMGLDEGELAAWTLLASALLNLHSTITQG